MIAEFLSDLTVPSSLQSGSMTLVTTLFGAAVSVPLGLRCKRLLNSIKERTDNKKAGLRLLHSIGTLKNILRANGDRLREYRAQKTGDQPVEEPGLEIAAFENLGTEFFERLEPPELTGRLRAHFERLSELVPIQEALRASGAAMEPDRRTALLHQSIQLAQALQPEALMLSHAIEGARLRLRRQIVKRRPRRNPLTGR